MNNEEKMDLILNKVTGIEKEQSEIKDDISDMKDDIYAMKDDISGLEKEQSNIKDNIKDMKENIDKIADETANLTLFRDETNSKLDIIIETLEFQGKKILDNEKEIYRIKNKEELEKKKENF